MAFFSHELSGPVPFKREPSFSFQTHRFPFNFLFILNSFILNASFLEMLLLGSLYHRLVLFYFKIQDHFVNMLVPLLSSRLVYLQCTFSLNISKFHCFFVELPASFAQTAALWNTLPQFCFQIQNRVPTRIIPFLSTNLEFWAHLRNISLLWHFYTYFHSHCSYKLFDLVQF